MIVIDIFLIMFLFFLFGVSHSFLASLNFKKRLAENIGNKIAFYRLFYNVSSLLFFFIAYQIAPKPDVVVYDLQYPYDIITFAIQILSLAGLVWAAKPIDMMQFIGLSQIQKYFKGDYIADELDEKMVLKIEGAYKYMRHPIYFFSILFLVFRPTMNLFYLTMLVCLITYFYIGSICEEKKMVEIFGDEYKNYQKNVPSIIPIKFIK